MCSTRESCAILKLLSVLKLGLSPPAEAEIQFVVAGLDRSGELFYWPSPIPSNHSPFNPYESFPQDNHRVGNWQRTFILILIVQRNKSALPN